MCDDLFRSHMRCAIKSHRTASLIKIIISISILSQRHSRFLLSFDNDSLEELDLLDLSPLSKLISPPLLVTLFQKQRNGLQRFSLTYHLIRNASKHPKTCLHRSSPDVFAIYLHCFTLLDFIDSDRNTPDK